jgi:Domain of unknown function (DUF4232)
VSRYKTGTITVALLAFGASACGSGPKPAAPTTSAPAHEDTTSTSPGTRTTTTVAHGATTSTAAALTGCSAVDLAGSVTGSQGAAGTIETTISLRNSSSPACSLVGYPGLTLLDAGGNALPTNTVRGGGLQFENVPVTTVVLAPGQAALINMGTSDVPTGSETCSAASKLRIYPPNAVDTLTVSLELTVCAGGTIHSSPVYPSSAASADGAA